MAFAKRQLKSWTQLCEYAAQQMESTRFSDWPLYPDDPDELAEVIGSDSTGGTEHKVYAEIMRKGVLTIDSQEGTCETFNSLPANHPLRMSDGFVEAAEKQRSYVIALVPHDVGAKIIQAFADSSESQRYYYIWLDHEQKLVTTVPEKRLNVTNLIYRNTRGIDTEDKYTNVDLRYAGPERDDSLSSIQQWIRPQDRQSFDGDLKALRMGVLYFIDKDYCSGRESAGRVLLRFLQQEEKDTTHVKDPITGRCIVVGGATWRQRLAKFGEAVYSYHAC